MAGQAQEDPGHRDSEELCRRSGLLQEYKKTPAESPGRRKEPPRPEGQRQNSRGGASIDKHNAWRFESIVATKLLYSWYRE